MLPALAYTIEPLNVSRSGGTTTTFGGAAVWAGPPSPEPVPPPFVPPFEPPTKGTVPLSRLRVTNATRSNPTTDSAGATHRPGEPTANDGRDPTGGVDERVMTRPPRATAQGRGPPGRRLSRGGRRPWPRR